MTNEIIKTGEASFEVLLNGKKEVFRTFKLALSALRNTIEDIEPIEETNDNNTEVHNSEIE